MRNFLKITAGLIVAILLFQNCQKSDFLVITGVVRDSITNLPIEGVYVFSQNGGYALTNEDGTYSLNGIQPSRARIMAASLNGYNQNYKTITISDGRVNKIDFLLKPVEKPDIETNVVSNITKNSATVKGSLYFKDDVWASQVGFCWSSTNTDPTIYNNEGSINVGNASSNISFTGSLTNLQSDKAYYVRAYAYVEGSYIYGNTVSFTTSEIPIYGLITSHNFANGVYDDNSGNNFYTFYYWYPPTFVTDRNGIPNNAAEFSGTNYSGIYYNNYSIPFEFGDFAISLWFNKPGSWENESQKLYTIGYAWAGNTRVYISQGASPNNFSFGINPGGTEYKITLTSYPSANTWHHLVAQRKGSKLQLYLDGSLAGETSCSTQIINNYGGWMFIGFTWLQEHFRGKMDDVKLYDKALTTSEIQYLKTH